MAGPVPHRTAHHISRLQQSIAASTASKTTNPKNLLDLPARTQSLIICTRYLRGYGWWYNCTAKESYTMCPAYSYFHDGVPQKAQTPRRSRSSTSACPNRCLCVRSKYFSTATSVMGLAVERPGHKQALSGCLGSLVG